MKKITVKPAFILSLLFCAVIIFFLVFGAAIRNYYSPKVEIIEPFYYSMPSGLGSSYTLPDSCINYDMTTGEAYVYTVKESDETGEMCFHVYKQYVNIRDSSDGYTATSGIEGGKVIFSADREFKEGERVVIAGEVNLQ